MLDSLKQFKHTINKSILGLSLVVSLNTSLYADKVAELTPIEKPVESSIDYKKMLELTQCDKTEHGKKEICTNKEGDIVLINGKLYFFQDPTQMNTYTSEMDINPDICETWHSKRGVLPFEICVGEFLLNHSGYYEAKNDGEGNIIVSSQAETFEQAKKRLLAEGYDDEYIMEVLSNARTRFIPDPIQYCKTPKNCSI